MSLAADAIKALRDMVLLTAEVGRLADATSELAKENRDLRDRVIRLETIIDMAREHAKSRVLAQEKGTR